MLNDMVWALAGAVTALVVCFSPLICHWLAVGIVAFINWFSDTRQRHLSRNYYTEQGHRRYADQ